MPTAISKPALSQLNNDSFPDNNLGEITPADLRDFNTNMITSLVDEIPFGTYTASVANTLSALNTFTASQQPSYTALNSFTASQLTINTGVNSFTQSATGRLNNLESTTSSLNAWSSSINQIIVNGTSIGTSTRFYFNGFVSASIVPNVNGAIASITVQSDPSLATTASFNAFTASINTWTASAKVELNNLELNSASVNISIAALNTNSASVNTSITALNQFTASDNTSQAALNAFTSSQLTINAGYNTTTASLNAYTQSTNTKINSLSSNTGSYATTGSNTFIGNQIVTGSFHISGSGADALQIDNGNIYAPTSTIAADTFQGSFVNLYNQYAGVGLGLNQAGSGSQYPAFNANVDSTVWPNDIFGGFQVQDPSLGYFTFIGAAANSYTAEYSGQVVGWIGGGGNNTNNSNTAFIMRQGSANLEVFKPTVFNFGTTTNGNSTLTGSIAITGSLTITGSVYGNVVSTSIVSSTASIDLSKANYFTLTLSGTTKINVINPQPGVTATLVINTSTSPVASFSSNVKQPSGSLYVASPSGNVDIISFTAVNTNTVYAFPAQSFV